MENIGKTINENYVLVINLLKCLKSYLNLYFESLYFHHLKLLFCFQAAIHVQLNKLLLKILRPCCLSVCGCSKRSL